MKTYFKGSSKEKSLGNTVLNSVKPLIFVMVKSCVFFDVRAELLNNI
jgi:hypothetical protein